MPELERLIMDFVGKEKTSVADPELQVKGGGGLYAFLAGFSSFFDFFPFFARSKGGPGLRH